MKRFCFLTLIFWTSNVFSHANQKFFENHVIRRERVENMVSSNVPTKKKQLEYLILRDHSLWVRQISPQLNVAHLPKLISFGAFVALDLIVLDGHLFASVAYPVHPSEQYLMELNIQKTIEPYRAGYIAGAIANYSFSAITAHFMMTDFGNGSYFVGAVQALATAYFIYQGSHGCHNAVICQGYTGLFNYLVTSERSEPLRIDKVIYHPTDFSVQDIRLTTSARKNSLLLSQWLANRDCASSLSIVEAPSVAPF